MQCAAPSKLNCPTNVPATALTLTAVRPAAEPPYACGAHATVVADVHALLLHTSVTASDAVGVKSDRPKLSPLIVTDPLELTTMFGRALGGLLMLTHGAGASEQHNPIAHAHREIGPTWTCGKRILRQQHLATRPYRRS